MLNYVLYINPYIYRRRIMYYSLIITYLKILIRMYVIVNFYIGSISDIITSAHKFSELFNYIPVIIIIKLVAESSKKKHIPAKRN